MRLKEEMKKMQTVNVGELKNGLNRYLENVKRGEEIEIREHNRPIAKLVPLIENDYENEEAELMALGLLSPPKLSKLPDSFWDDELPDINLETVVKVITDERKED
jgi:prevent-host-death family protein